MRLLAMAVIASACSAPRAPQAPVRAGREAAPRTAASRAPRAAAPRAAELPAAAVEPRPFAPGPAAARAPRAAAAAPPGTGAAVPAAAGADADAKAADAAAAAEADADAKAADAAAAAEAAAADAITRVALDALAARDFAAVAAAFAPGGAPTADQVAAMWAARAGALGPVTRWAIVDRALQDGFQTRVVRIELVRGPLQALLVIAPETGRIASLFVSPPAPPARYVDAARFREEPVTVGAAPYPLGGTLTLPAGPGPFPAAVLVHGSGPNDRDETIGSNKIFKDLAEGLASAGVAVLRYDKRTYRYGDRLTSAITLDEETLDDAVAAVRALAARPGVDARRLFVIGHSLGGRLAPEIAVRARTVAGAVLLAPPGRPPWDILLAQMRYLHAPRATLAAIERAITEIPFGGTPALLGLPFAYWRDLASRDGVAMARAFGRPVLVLQGDRDYQVTAEDLQIWRRGLAGAPHAEFATLPGDNHLFIRGAGAPGPAEYKLPGHVDERVIERVLAFIRRP